VKAGRGPEVGGPRSSTAMVARSRAATSLRTSPSRAPPGRASVLDAACKGGAVVGHRPSGGSAPRLYLAGLGRQTNRGGQHIRLKREVAVPSALRRSARRVTGSARTRRTRRSRGAGRPIRSRSSRLDMGKSPAKCGFCARGDAWPHTATTLAVVVEQAILGDSGARPRARRAGSAWRRFRVWRRARCRIRGVHECVAGSVAVVVSDGRELSHRDTYLGQGAEPSLRPRVVDDSSRDPRRRRSEVAIEDIKIPGRAGAEDTARALRAPMVAISPSRGVNARKPALHDEHRIVVGRTPVREPRVTSTDRARPRRSLDSTILGSSPGGGGGRLRRDSPRSSRDQGPGTCAGERERTEKVLISTAHEAGVRLTADAAKAHLVRTLADDDGRVRAVGRRPRRRRKLGQPRWRRRRPALSGRSGRGAVDQLTNAIERVIRHRIALLPRLLTTVEAQNQSRCTRCR